MTPESSHGAATRRPVVHGGSRINGLYERTLKDGTIVYEYRVRINGALRRGTIKHAATRTDAVREFHRLLSDRDYGVERENRLMNPTVEELVDEWLADLRSRIGILDEKRRVAQRTVVNYDSCARRHIKPVLRSTRVAQLDTADVRRVLKHTQDQGLAPKTTTLVLKTLSAALQFAHENGYVPRNVVRDLPRSARPGDKRLTEPRYLTHDEVLALLDAASPSPRLQIPLRPIAACCFYAALRIGEALGLQWECVDFKADLIIVRQQAAIDSTSIVPYAKTDSSAATVALFPALKRELLQHRSRMAEVDLRYVQPAALVFVGRFGQMLRRDHMLKALKRVTGSVGLNPPGAPPIGFHDLRHSAAALALQHGAGPEQTAELLRHAGPMVTMTAYAGLNADTRGAATRKLLDAGIGI